VGALQVFGRLGRTAARRIAIGTATLLLVSLTGILSQLTGQAPPKLHLNNGGIYYDIYYMHPEEQAGVAWLQNRITADADHPVQSEVITDRYTLAHVQNYSQLYNEVEPGNDIFPAYVRYNSYVLLGYTTSVKGEVSAFYSGDIFTYEYPTAFLDHNKNLIYSTRGARVYR
jgi:hypothetical protein